MTFHVISCHFWRVKIYDGGGGKSIAAPCMYIKNQDKVDALKDLEMGIN